MGLSKFRVKEFAINTDGTNIWFYPQVLVTKKETKGMWFWKKESTNEEYHSFYDKGDYVAIKSKSEADEMSSKEQETIVGFRTKHEAESWLITHVRKIRKDSASKNEKAYKYLGGVSDDTDENKSHNVKID